MGGYTFKNIQAGNYYIMVKHLEYETQETAIFPLSAGNLKSIETIRLQNGSLGLYEVVVVAQKPLFEIQADKIVFNVAASPSA